MIKFFRKNKNRFEKFEELLKKDNINFSIQESPTCKEYNFSKNYSNTVTFGKVVIFKNNYQNLITICIFRDISKYSKKRFLEIANELNSEFFNVNFFLLGFIIVTLWKILNRKIYLIYFKKLIIY